MGSHIGLDVSQRLTSVCVIDEFGTKIWQGSVASRPDILAEAIRQHGTGVCKVGMETGPLAVWLFHALHERGIDVDCIHAQHVHAALTVQLNKTDRNDAAGIAQLVRSGWYRPVHVRSLQSHELRLLLTARAKLLGMRTAASNQIRGLLKTFGVVLGVGRRQIFDDNVAQSDPLCAGVKPIVTLLLETWRHLSDQIREIDRRLERQARHDPVCRLLMTAPGVGAMTAVSFRTVVDQHERFHRLSDVGPFLGLVPRKYQSGDVNRDAGISKHGNRQTRALLYEAALALLKRSSHESGLKTWAMEAEKRLGLRKAVVALARKLATVLLSMWRSGQPFAPSS